MTCPRCQQYNRESATTCVQCGASLRAVRADLYLNRAEAALDVGDYRMASEQLTRADGEMLLLTAEQRGGLLAVRASWIHASIAYREGRMSEAVTELRHALSLSDEPDTTALRASILNRLGSILYYSEEYAEAVVYFQQSSDLAAELGLHNVAAKALSNLAAVAYQQHDDATANAYFQRALEQAELQGDAESIANISRTLAVIYSYIGPFSLALKYAERALEVYDQIANVDSRCTIIVQAAEVYLHYGDLDRAESYLREAERLTRNGAARIVTELLNTCLAELMWRRGEISLMRPYLQNTRPLTGDSVTWGEPEMLFAHYYVATENWQSARNHLRSISSKANERQNVGTKGTIHFATALLCAALADVAEAQAAYDRALDPDLLRPYYRAEVLVAYADFLHRQGEGDGAQAALHEAASLYRQLELPQQLANVELALSNLVSAD